MKTLVILWKWLSSLNAVFLNILYLRTPFPLIFIDGHPFSPIWQEKKLNFTIKTRRGLVDKLPKGYAFMKEREHIVVVIAWDD